MWLGRVWAIATRKRRVRIKSNKWRETRPFWKDWVIACLKVFGFPLFALLLFFRRVGQAYSEAAPISTNSDDDGSWTSDSSD